MGTNGSTRTGPDALLDSLADAARAVVDHATALPQDIADDVANAAQGAQDGVAELTDALVKRLRDLIDNPDWNTLLLLVLLQLVSKDDGTTVVAITPSTKVGTAVGVKWAPPAPATSSVVVGLCLNPEPGKARGLVVRMELAVADQVDLDAKPVTVTLQANGGFTGRIEVPFGGAVVVGKDAGGEAALTVAAVIDGPGPMGAGASVGDLNLHASFTTRSAQDPPYAWSASIGLGTKGDAGHQGIELDLSPQQLLGFEPPVLQVDIGRIAFSPLAAVAGPPFTRTIDLQSAT